MKRIIAVLIFGLGFAVLYAAQNEAVSENEPFRQEGIASWYGAEFEGRPTASGELFDPADFTAAHPSLPFGTVLKVTNQHNDKHVTVRVNDRGPFVSARIIDVSRAAAEQLDMINTGTAPVTVEGIERIVRDSGGDAADGDSAEDTQPVVAEARPASAAAQPADSAVYPASPAVRPPAQAAPVQTFALPPAEIKPAIPPAGSAKRYRLQVGAYKIPRNAADAFDRLKNAGLDPAYEHVGDLYRVVISGVPGGEVRAAAEKIGAAGFREALIREEP